MKPVIFEIELFAAQSYINVETIGLFVWIIKFYFLFLFFLKFKLN